MILRDLIKGVKAKKVLGRDDVEIHGISYHSKKVKEGFLFAAIRGVKVDGHKYIGSALKNGARAVLLEAIPEKTPTNVSFIQVKDTKSALSEISANFFHHPTKELALVGITGTDGKTTTSYLLESILKGWGKNTGVIGTVDYRFSNRKIPSERTTPESLDLMNLLSDMRASGVEYVVMEVSSHALDRKRALGCHFDAALFTNLSHEHLDYHTNMESYFKTKKSLFSDVLKKSEKGEKFSIINFDDPYGREIAKDAAGTVVSYSIRGSDATVCVEKSDVTPQGIFAVVNTPWGKIGLKSQLLGGYNLYNILAASAAALSLGASTGAVEEGISKLVSIPGRLERIETPIGITVLIDYAHTPYGLKSVLTAARSLTSGKLILVFGCRGERDPTKRPIMGKIGKELSDILIITSNSPYTEDPERIIDEIEGGFLGEGSKGKPYFRISDRYCALQKAIEVADRGDVVLITGRGHKNHLVVGTEKIPFNDKQMAEEIICTTEPKREPHWLSWIANPADII
jgi:UDP-N-acetylmuramoyl-L-alanyl-D-glutamate--2,6-diaminopimelate ligase